MSQEKDDTEQSSEESPPKPENPVVAGDQVVEDHGDPAPEKKQVWEMWFDKPEFRKGRQTTFRLGDKWLYRVSDGGFLHLMDAKSEEPVGHGEVVGVSYLPYPAIPQEFFRRHHSKKDEAAISNDLAETYGKKFTDNPEEAMVTTILFQKARVSPKGF